ncbi:MAG: class I SAM-dependent methyltransferase [Chitinophagaceae bacterium]
MTPKINPVLQDISSVNKRSRYYLVYYYLHKAIASVVSKYANGKVLDIGCGYKPYKKIFAGNKTVTAYTGCDLNQTSLDTVDIIYDGKKIPLLGESIDTIFSTQVIEHVFDHGQILREAYRLLKMNGKIILSAPLYWPVHGEPHDFYRFTKFGLDALLKKNGFKTLEIMENGGAWATAGQSLVHSFEFSTKRSVFFRGLRFLFFHAGGLWLTNTFFKWADKTDYNPVNTINYVVVAEKI